MKLYYKFIFVILVYRNTTDLEECLISINKHIKSYKVIVTNAYYDDKSLDTCRSIALKYDCDFINIENKGYSYGNNRGIEMALNLYTFDFLIVSNPDIEILKFDEDILENEKESDIFAPRITTLTNKSQNPMSIKRIPLAETLEYLGFKNKSKLLLYAGISLSKISRGIHNLLYQVKGRSKYQIYGAHGSFVIFKRHAIEKLNPIYDENMFLFAEEGVLAYKANKENIKTCYVNTIHIKHKEDGSMKLSNLSVNNMMAEANMYYYEQYIKKNETKHDI